MEKETFHNKLKHLMDRYVHGVYDITFNFPKEKIFGVTSQIRRSSMSVMLNYIEGFARQKKAVMKNFYEISYGSLKESKYLLHFALKRNYIEREKYLPLIDINEQIGKMLWGTISKIG